MQKSDVGMILIDRGANRGIYFNSVFLVCCVVLLSFLREFLCMNGITFLTL